MVENGKAALRTNSHLNAILNQIALQLGQHPITVKIIFPIGVDLSMLSDRHKINPQVISLMSVTKAIACPPSAVET